MKTFYLKTFGCQGNVADSEKIVSRYQKLGYRPTNNPATATVAIINTCVVREAAENRAYGLIKKLKQLQKKNPQLKIIITGCLVGAASREPSGVRRGKLKKISADCECVPIEKFFSLSPTRSDKRHAFVSIGNGCNNACSYCIVPLARGREISRSFIDIIKEAKNLARRGYSEITLIGQNVNSYGADLVVKNKKFKLPDGKKVEPILVKSLGKTRIPTLFPYLLEEIAKIKKFKKISFISANPWDFSDQLIKVIASHPQINREIHLPVQAGDNTILKKMNRLYTREEYLKLIKKIKKQVPDASFTTDIIVGFPGETVKQFGRTVDLYKKVGFNLAYIACYSPRIGTMAAKKFTDNVPFIEKKRRFHVLDKLINKKVDDYIKLGKFSYFTKKHLANEQKKPPQY
ncbi:MAG: MiaB/RimO family radical SAM methylthiotransferase [Patescibacteria group bacterium]